MVGIIHKLHYWVWSALLLMILLPTAKASDIVVNIQSDETLFYEELSHHGDWVKSDSGKYLWIPTATPVDWRPYTIGQWAYNQTSGWVWISGWSWGWAPFHYGRWMFHPEHGWAWQPGSEWAPA